MKERQRLGMFKPPGYFEKKREQTPEATQERKKKRKKIKKVRRKNNSPPDVDCPRFKERIIKLKKKKIEFDHKRNKKYQENRVSYHEKEHDYLKFYAPVMNWASVKYGIRKEFIEIGFFFYNHPVFTREQFTELCVMFSKKPNVTFLRFLREGYIVGREIGNQHNKLEVHYRLSIEFFQKLKHIYRVMQLEKIPRNFDYTQNTSKRSVLQTTLRALQKEVDEIQSGRLLADKVVFRNEEEN